MLPTNIITIYKKLVQKICILNIKQGQRRQFLFGLKALSARPFISLNSNARTTLTSRSAAESKMARLLRNTKLQQQLAKLHLKLSGVKPNSLVNVDHSEFNGLSVLMFASQTRKGRAMPVYLETMPSLAQGHKITSKKYLESKTKYAAWKQQTGLDQYGYTIHCIGKLAKQLGFMPRLVFDRGFCNKRILKYLKRNKTICYIRARAWLKVTMPDGTKKRISEFASGSHIVSFGCRLRLVVGDKLNEHNEPWYIFTTDLVASPAEILNIYYYRFEIEELFRDMKSLLLTKGSRLKKAFNLATLLWYICLGILLLHLSQPKTPKPEQQPNIHHKKKLSGFRILFEEFEKELRSLVYFNDKSAFW
jgi:hypothetical protein